MSTTNTNSSVSLVQAKIEQIQRVKAEVKQRKLEAAMPSQVTLRSRIRLTISAPRIASRRVTNGSNCRATHMVG